MNVNSLPHQIHQLLLPTSRGEWWASVSLTFALFCASALPWIAQVQRAKRAGHAGFPLSVSYALCITVATIWSVLLGMSAAVTALIEKADQDVFILAVPLAFLGGRLVIQQTRLLPKVGMFFLLFALVAFQDSLPNRSYVIAGVLVMAPALAAGVMHIVVSAFHVEIGDDEK